MSGLAQITEATPESGVVEGVNAAQIIAAGAIEQARYRVGLLHQKFNSVLDVLIEMHRDEDWRHLTDAAGIPYGSFTAMLVGEMQISDSYARRQQQLIQMVLPLRELTHPQTRIPVTAADVVALGQQGTRHVQEQAADVLEGVQDPRDQERALRSLIDSTRKTMAGQIARDAADGDDFGAARSVPDGSSQKLSGRDRNDDSHPWDTADPASSAEPGIPTAADAHDGDTTRETPARSSPSVNADPSVAAVSHVPATSSLTEPDDVADRLVTIEADTPQRADESAKVAEEALAAIADGGDPYTAAVKLLSAPLPETVRVDVTAETVTAAMLQLTQLRSQLLAAGRPEKTRRRRYGAK